jgi:hypothetical protein
MKLPDKLLFISSTRFWALVIGAISLYLKTNGWIGEPEMVLIATITAGFITVKTVDRVSEKLGSNVPESSNL